MLLPDTTLENALQLDYDLVALPGGLPGADYLNEDPRIQDLIKKMAGENKFTAAICAAPKVLASAGLLEGVRATAYPGTLEKLDLSSTTIGSDPVIQDGKIITSRGPGTAMDFALALIEILLGSGKREEVEVGLQRP
jgi:4-methyl-5(b-hydroxyethyl)-thiazole monophosphate biosynthesis